MQVSRCGFLAWQKRPKSARQRHNEALTEQIKTVFEESQQTYGRPRVHAELTEGGIACSRKRVARLMRRAGMGAVPPKRFVVTTDSSHDKPVAQNLLDRSLVQPQTA